LVYGWMLLEDFRFGNATRRKINREIRIGAELARTHPDESRRVAVSYGLISE